MHSEIPDDHPARSEPTFPSGSADLPGYHPAREPWTLLDLVFFAVFAFLAFILIGILALGAYSALMPLMGWHMPPRAMGRNTFFLLGVEVGFYALIFAYIYLLVVVHYRLRFWEGIRWGRLTRAGIARYVAAGIVLTIAVQLFPAFLPDKTNFPLERMFSSPGASYALAVFAIVIGPFMEELVFRGILFSIFEARVGIAFAIVATAVLFAALHISEYQGAWNHVFLIFVVGLVLSVTRGVTGALAPSVVIHATYNSCLMIALFLASSHFRMIQGLMK